MKRLITLAVFIGLTSLAFAGEFNNLEELKPSPKCRGLKITDVQKTDIKTLIQTTRNEIKKHVPGIKKGKKALRTIMLDASTTKEEAKAAHINFRTLLKPVRKLKMQAKAALNFDILTGEQRVKLLKCKKRANRRHPRRGGHNI